MSRVRVLFMIRLKPKVKSKRLKRTPFKRKPPKKIAFLTKTPPKLRKNLIKKPPEPTKKPPKKRSGLRIRIDPLDALFSTYIRTRDNFTCQRCGVKSKFVQCAHFIGRRNKATRWLETNATTLCMGCHGYFHANPLIFVEWTKQRLGEKDFNFLLAQERIITKPDKKAIEIYLRAKLAEITA
jgi:hypothetical protein